MNSYIPLVIAISVLLIIVLLSFVNSFFRDYKIVKKEDKIRTLDTIYTIDGAFLKDVNEFYEKIQEKYNKINENDRKKID